MGNKAVSGHMRKAALALIFAGLVFPAEIYAAQASDIGTNKCRGAALNLIPQGRPYLLNDPRSGLMLYVESDGRHVAAISHDGKLVWQRNIFDDKKLADAITPPPLVIPREPIPSEKQHEHQKRLIMRDIAVDRIGVASDCEARVIDHDYGSRLFRGHYILAGSGTHFEYLLEATTGDFMLSTVN